MQSKSANPLLTTDCGVTLVSKSIGLANPDVIPVVTSFTWASGCITTFDASQISFSLNGGCPTLRDYDGLGATSGTITHKYKSGAVLFPGAIVMNKNSALHWNTVVSAFSWSDIRDPFGGVPGRAEKDLAGRILSCALPVGCLQGENPVDSGPDDTAAPPFL